MHAGLAGDLSKLVLVEKADVTIVCGTKTANAKSLLSILSLGLRSNDRFIISVDGEDEADILNNITNFVEKLKIN